jgi:hypothetical protein
VISAKWRRRGELSSRYRASHRGAARSYFGEPRFGVEVNEHQGVLEREIRQLTGCVLGVTTITRSV